jgi:hypothetical protein
MESGYEIEPGPLGRSTRRTPAIVAAIVVVLCIVIAKPWQGPPPPPVAVSVIVAVPSTATAASPLPTAIATTAWPAASGGPPETTLPAWADAVLAPLVRHSGTWGVGDGGAGFRYTRDNPSVGWAAVTPEASQSTPGTIFLWPGTGLCTGLPTIDDRPAFIAVTTPRSLSVDWHLTGWWSDGNQVASLGDSVRQISSPGERGIKFLERRDSAAWPPGRYEFHVVDGDSTVALTICLVRPE